MSQSQAKTDRQEYYSLELAKHLLTEIKEYAIFMMDREGILSTWNPGVERLLGYSEEQFIGQHFSLIFSEKDLEASIPTKELQQALKTGRAEDKRWHMKKDRSLFWANGLVTATKDTNGEISGFVKIMRDETAQRNYETQIREYASKLQDSNADLKNFAGVVSHDLSAPLRTIVGFTTIVDEKARGIDEEVDASIDYIREGAERMLTLVDELLQFTAASNRQLVLEDVDSNLIVQHALENLHTQIQGAKATVIYGKLPVVHGDSVQLGRLFQNLVDNAIKYRKPSVPLKIEIQAHQKGRETVFSISDNGQGLDDSSKGRIFELFNRADSVSTASGYGIGLATCKKIAELFGGRIWVESTKGHGATFSFSVTSEPVQVARNAKNEATEALLSH